jgi:hypothetical protein
MSVRVIRILEYVYPDHSRCEQDMQRWAVGANSAQRHGDMTISSATMMPRTVGENEQSLGEAQEYPEVSGAGVPYPQEPQLPMATLDDDGRLVDSSTGIGIMLDELVERYNALVLKNSKQKQKPPAADPKVWPGDH